MEAVIAQSRRMAVKMVACSLLKVEGRHTFGQRIDSMVVLGFVLVGNGA